MTSTYTRTHTVAFDIPGRTVAPLTATTSAVADLVAAILQHTRPHLPQTRPVHAVIEPDMREGYLRMERDTVGTFRIRDGGAS
jgi:hypothetical protein